MPDVDRRAQGHEAPGGVRGAKIRTADAIPAGQQDVRDGAHPRPADADEVDARVAIDHENPLSAAAITSAATSRAPCGRPRRAPAIAIPPSRDGSAPRPATTVAKRTP